VNQNSKEKLNEVFAPIKMESERRFTEMKGEDNQNILIGMATCGLASGALEVKAAFEEVIAERKINAHIIPVGCLGHCYAEPLVIIEKPGFPPILYHDVTPGKARLLVKAFVEEDDPVFEHILGAMEENDLIPSVMEFTRFNQEKRIVMANSGLINPEDIYQYIAKGGYSALVKALSVEPQEIINEVKESGLRGRGGAGFSTGKKWQFVRDSREEGKTVICNADEGDPGAYMDRTILESSPHQIIEGIAISAYAVGAKKAIIYIRAEYPLAVKMTKKAIEQANDIGLSISAC
jgi:NADH-quinone oxidoreductase subunit F